MPNTLPLEEIEFQNKVLDGLEAQQKTIAQFKTDQEKILSDVDRLGKESKTALEELTKVKNTCNDTAVIKSKMDRLEMQVRREAAHAFGHPVDRALANGELRTFINSLVRRLTYPNMKLPPEMERSFTGVDSSLGAATIPVEYSGEIYSLLLQYGRWNTLRVMDVGARSNIFPIQTARPTYYWIGASTGGSAETTAITEGSMTGTYVTLAIQTLGTLLHVSRELIQDSTVDIAPQVMRDLSQGLSYGLDFMAFAANAGADQVDAGYYGIFESGTVNTNCVATAAAGGVKVELTDLEDWELCLAGVTTSVLESNARWWMHPKLVSKACLVRDGNKRPIFQTALEVPSPGAIGSILGYPIIRVGAAPSTNAASAKVAVFGDPEGYVVGIRMAAELATTDALKFAENMQSFRGVTRAGGIHRIGSGSPAAHVPFSVLTLPAA